jgi:formylglycine-generating enzyme
MPLINGRACIVVDRENAVCRAVSPLVINERDGSVLIEVPAGEFEMGDGREDNCPRHNVHLDRYWIGIYCVTNRQYSRFLGETGYHTSSPGAHDENPDLPAVSVSRFDVAQYVEWAGCCLPTEAQWEKAARGPLGLAYPWGDDWDESKCRTARNRGNEKMAPVWMSGRGVSGYGTYNQVGNVNELCADCLNPGGHAHHLEYAHRGGSWYDSHVPDFRAAHRRSGGWRGYSDLFGFRVARNG